MKKFYKTDQQYCIRGHDTYLAGRNESNGQCKECARILGKASQRRNRKLHPKYIQNANLKHKFNITLDIYEKMLLNQNGKCAVCNKSQESRRLAIDHDHKCCSGYRSCGKCIRALLCMRCNSVLGLVDENPEILRDLLTYLVQKTKLVDNNV